MPPPNPIEENDNENILVDATLIQNEKLDELNDSNDAQVQGIIQTNDHLEELNSGVDILIEKLSEEKDTLTKDEISQIIQLLTSIKDKESEVKISVSINGAEIGEVKLEENEETEHTD